MIVWNGRLPRRDLVRWPGVEREAVAAVLQADAGPGTTTPEPKPM